MKRTTSCLGAALLVWSGLGNAHDLVSSGPDGWPLPVLQTMEGDEFVPLEVSETGRFVLFANYSPDAPPDIIDIVIRNQGQCNIYRKDRVTGALDLVFESSADDERYYCRGAMMSADGNTIVAPLLSVPDNPSGELVEIDGVVYVSYGDVTTLTIADMRSNTRTDIKAPFRSNNANDIARINLGQGYGGFPVSLYGLATLSADGSRAIVARFSLTGRPLYEEVGYLDIASGEVVFGFLPQSVFSLATGPLTGLSLSADGGTLLVPLPYFSTSGNGVFSPVTQHIWLYRFASGSAEEVTELREEQPAPGIGLRTFSRRSLSADAGRISWVRGPAVCAPPFSFPAPRDEQPDFCNPETGYPVCEGEDCELTFARFDLNTRELDSETTLPDPDGSTPGFTNRVQFSADGARALYPRLVREPFGEGFRIDLFDREPVGNDNFVCVNRDSIDSGSGAPLIEPCVPDLVGPIRPENGGPILSRPDYTDYDSPTLWIVRDLDRDQEIQVSVHDGALFQSNRAVLSGDGRSVAFASRDSRLRTAARFPGDASVAFADDPTLDPACFWPSAEALFNLRIATNDNVRYFAGATQYVYETAPVFCPVPTPVNAGQVFAADIVTGFWPLPGRLIGFEDSGFGDRPSGFASGVTRNLRKAYAAQLRALIRTTLVGERTAGAEGAAANASQR